MVRLRSQSAHGPGSKRNEIVLQGLAHEEEGSTCTQVALNDRDLVTLSHKLNIKWPGNVQRLGNSTCVFLHMADNIPIEFLSRKNYSCISTVHSSILRLYRYLDPKGSHSTLPTSAVQAGHYVQQRRRRLQKGSHLPLPTSTVQDDHSLQLWSRYFYPKGIHFPTITSTHNQDGHHLSSLSADPFSPRAAIHPSPLQHIKTSIHSSIGAGTSGVKLALTGSSGTHLRVPVDAKQRG